MCCFGYGKPTRTLKVTPELPFYGYKSLRWQGGKFRSKSRSVFWDEGKLTSKLSKSRADGEGIYAWRSPYRLIGEEIVVEVSLWGEVQQYTNGGTRSNQGFKASEAEIHHIYVRNDLLAKKLVKAVKGSGIEVTCLKVGELVPEIP